MASRLGREPAPLPHPKPSKSFWHTQPSSLLQGYRSTRELPESADVVIIGAGIAGTSALHALLEPYRIAGHDAKAPSICVLEAREICWGATGRNGGHCQPLVYSHPEDPEIGRFELLNHATLATLAGANVPAPSVHPYYPAVPKPRKTFECEFVVEPSAHGYYAAEDANAVKANLRALHAVDPAVAAHCRLLTDGGQIKDARLPTAHAVVSTDIAGRLWPYKLVAGIWEDILLDPHLHKKVNLQTWTPANKLEKHKNGNWLVRTDRGHVRAKHVILATNAYTSHLLPDFADLIVPCLGTVGALLPSDGLKDEHRLRRTYGFNGASMDDYLIQRPNETGGHLIYGGADEYGRVLGDADDSVVDDRAVKYLQNALPAFFGLSDRSALGVSHAWTGIMGFSRDEHVFVGPVPDRKGVFLAAGFSGHGMPNAWLVGKAAAVMVAELRNGKNEDDAVAEARAQTHLPRSYLLTRERMERARRKPDLEFTQGSHRDHMTAGGSVPLQV